MSLDVLAQAVAIGIGATACMDVFGLFRHRFFGARPVSYAMVGRWVGHLTKGRYAHDSIAAAPPIAGEAALGWATHYGVGAGFGMAFVAIMGAQWLATPTLLPALLFGLVTTAAPFLIMQPGMGAGVAAARTPAPWTARRQSLTAHASFGVGLYVAAALARWATPM